MTSSCKITALALLVAYALFCFSVPPSTSATPSLRGGIPSLYMKVAVGETLGVRGAAAAAALTGSHEFTTGMEAGASDDESFCARTVFEALAVLMSIIALVLRIPQSRYPTRMTITISAILIAYALFSFGAPPSTSATPHLRGGIPSLYMQPPLRHVSGVRGGAVAEMANETKLDEEVASSCTYAVAEVLAFSMSIMALAQKIPQSRSHSRMMITVSAILVAYALFCFSIPRTMNVTPHVRGAIPSLYAQPVFSANSGLRGAVVSSTLTGMDIVEKDEAYDESYQSLPDLGVALSESFGPVGYWVALSVPAIAMTYLTQRKEHSKLH